MIDISIFQGEIPRVSAKRLPSENAAKAVNCRLESGPLEPMKGVSKVETDVGAAVQTIYRMSDQFLRWDAMVDVVKSLVADSGNRIFYTGDSYPKDTNAALALTSSPYPAATRRLGIPAPATALVISLNGTPGEDVERSPSYTYTFVAKWEDGSEVESGPAPPTAVIDIHSGIIPQLSAFETPSATGVYATHIRIYRMESGNVGSDYYFTDEILISQTLYDDTKTDDEVIVDDGELKTTGFDAPDDDLAGLIATSHGIVVGYKGNTIYPSAIFHPYTFPAEYTQPTESDIVGLGYTGSMIMALTKTVPYLFIGQDPSTIEPKRLGYQQPCLSARSIVNVPGGVVYASPDGLFMINESGIGDIITAKIFTKSQWKELGPANLIGIYYDDAYFGFFAGTTIGFRLNLGSGDYHPIELTGAAHGGHYSPDDDLLYLIQENGATRDIVSWDTGDFVEYLWLSKLYSFPSQSILTAGLIEGDFSKGNVDFTLYVDGTEVFNKTIFESEPFRIPGHRGSRFQVEVTGLATIDRILIAESMSDIMGAVYG